MRIPIPCRRMRFRLTVGLRVFKPTSLYLSGQDAEHYHTNFVFRGMNFELADFENGSAYKEVQVPFPLAPEFMMFEIWDSVFPDDPTFRLEKFEAEAMEPREIWEQPDIHNFIPFASWFAKRAGYLSSGIYESPDQRFRIEYLPIIVDHYGKKLVTPARTHRKTGRIQASQQHLIPLSVPVRWFIMMHERKHFQLPTRKEKVADLSALRVFLDFGFPKVEAIYAATRAMNANTPAAMALKGTRLKDIHSFVDNYIERNRTQNNSTVSQAA